jgi:hypothetical protein
MIVFIVTIFLTAVVCVTGAFAIMLAVTTSHIRQAYAIPARPLLMPTTTEQIPPDLAAFLAQVVPALNDLGFAAVASVHAPQMLASISWTQILFIRGERGDRASVMLLRANRGTLAATPPTLAFATELPDGRSVKTGMRQPASGSANLHDGIAALYRKHRTDVDRQLGGDAIGLIPEPGDEIAWLQARAGAIASVLAKDVGFVEAAEGQSFRPPWRWAMRVAWKELWTRRARARRQGFEITPSVAIASPTVLSPLPPPPNSR